MWLDVDHGSVRSPGAVWATGFMGPHAQQTQWCLECQFHFTYLKSKILSASPNNKPEHFLKLSRTSLNVLGKNCFEKNEGIFILFFTTVSMTDPDSWKPFYLLSRKLPSSLRITALQTSEMTGASASTSRRTDIPKLPLAGVQTEMGLTALSTVPP